MTKRLVGALLVFTALILLITILPLGLSVSGHIRSDYSRSTADLARSLATLAEDAFDDARKPVSPQRLSAAAGNGVSVTVTDLAGRPLATTGSVPPAPPDLLAAARAGRAVTATYDDQVVAAVPVLADGATRGIVVVARPDEPVDHRIARLWLVLGGVALIALALAIGLATGAARWVGLPLRRLQVIAQSWAEGSLHGRAEASAGPPEVRETAAALNVMAARLDTLVHASRAVVADVSHQVRTPLAAMRLRLELVRDELAATRPSTASEDIDVALAELTRLSRLVDGLLTVARAESTDTAKTAVDVGAVVSDRLTAWEPVAADRGVTLQMQCVDDAFASATPGHLDQVLDNLLDNSLEALVDGGRVALRVRRDNDGVTLEVDDDGPGMAQAVQQSAFHRFASGRPDAGTGLGLAVVHRLVTADGGDVALVCPPSGGTRVTIRLPAARRPPSHQPNAPVDHADRQRG